MLTYILPIYWREGSLRKALIIILDIGIWLHIFKEPKMCYFYLQMFPLANNLVLSFDYFVFVIHLLTQHNRGLLLKMFWFGTYLQPQPELSLLPTGDNFVLQSLFFCFVSIYLWNSMLYCMVFSQIQLYRYYWELCKVKSYNLSIPESNDPKCNHWFE